MNFWKSCLASFLALMVFFVVVVVFFIGLVGSLSSEQEIVVKENSVLHLKLDGQVSELQQENPFEGLPMFGAEDASIGLLQLKQAIKHAKGDGKIAGIYLDVSYPQTGYASLEEVRQALIDFRESGKWVIAYADVMSEGAYYLATAADKIYLNPHGDVEFNGLTVEVSFFKKLLDKLEVKPQVFRVGEFKSAVEPFLMEKMSPENRLQLTEMVNNIYGNMLDEIAKARKLPKEKLQEIANGMLVRNAALAKEYGLVDDLYYNDQFQAELRKRLGLGDKDKIPTIGYQRYRKSFSDYVSSPNEIAVIVAEGTIMPGSSEGQDGLIGADTFVKEIRKAREDKDVKAIVLRINSPGGEFRSSDMIWREVQLARAVKPVIASMSDYAASGGYYMAMGCDTIVARPNTITGSIGIFGVMFDMSGLLNNKIGVTFDEVKTGQFGEMYTVTRPMTDAEKNFWQTNLEELYKTFTQKAADGRHMPVDDILKVASGRVWTGAQADGRGLVDVQGGFDDAVQIAARKAGVENDYKVRFYPKVKSFLELWRSSQEEETQAAVRAELGIYYPLYEQMQHLQTYQGAQARMPFEFQIK